MGPNLTLGGYKAASWDSYRDYIGQGIRVVRTRKMEGGCQSPQGFDTDVASSAIPEGRQLKLKGVA